MFSLTIVWLLNVMISQNDDNSGTDNKWCTIELVGKREVVLQPITSTDPPTISPSSLSYTTISSRSDHILTLHSCNYNYYIPTSPILVATTNS